MRLRPLVLLAPFSMLACHAANAPSENNLAAAESLDNQGNLLSAMADNANNAQAEAALENAADAAHDAADAIKDNPESPSKTYPTTGDVAAQPPPPPPNGTNFVPPGHITT